MQEEIFKFSIVRNPQRISKEKLKTTLIHLIDDKNSNYPIYSKLIGVSKNREKIIRQARQSLGSVLKNLSELKTELVNYSDWILSQNEIKSDEFINKAKDLFGSLPELVKKSTFKNDKYKISESIIVFAIIRPKNNGFRSELMMARRVVFLLEHLATNKKTDSKTVRNILKATIILPGDLFPIGTNNKELRDKNEEAKKIRKVKIEKAKKEINQNLEKIRINNEAIDELSKAYSKHLFNVKNTPKLNAIKSPKLSIIPLEKFKRLSSNTKNIITKELGIKETIVDVAFAVNAIESENTSISKKFKFGLFDNELVRDNVAVIAERTCGACKILLVEDVKKENNFTGQTKGKVNQIAGQDLMMVRQKLLKYESNEIAHIENILKGESKSKKHRKLHRVEETIFEETEKTEETENELETTSRFELQSESSKTISKDTSRDAGVTVTATYGPVTVEAQGNYASNTASEESRNSSTTYAKDVVSRSLNKIKERVLKRRSRTDISEVEIINKHKIDNTKDNAENIAGIYRWVNKLYEAQVVNYGNRTMLEFMIPEPAAFYRFACNSHQTETNIQKPDEPGFCQAGRFLPLKPNGISSSNYMCFVGKYGVSDVQPPPELLKYKSSTVEYKTEMTDEGLVTFTKVNDKFSIPKGYNPVLINYHISGENSHSGYSKNINSHEDNIMVIITVAGQKVLSYYKNEIGSKGDIKTWENIEQTIEWKKPGLSSKEIALGSKINPLDFKISDEIILVGQKFGETVPISINGHTSLALSVVIQYSVLCERSTTLFQQWQIDTYNAIMNAYNVLKLEYEEAIESQQYETDINIQGQNPFINREIEKTELKKHAISILTGQQYEGFNAMWQDYREGFGYPEIDLQDAAKEGEFVQFFEQALEWKHATYLFYDYFWGRKQNWVETLKTKDTDPLFEKFLKAGYARVWIPIRPSFDQVVLNYIDTGGEPWIEKDAPQINAGESNEDIEQSSTLSIIEEIKEQLDNDFILRPGFINVTKDSKEVIGIDTDFSLDDVNREILINLESYRIAEFVSPLKIILREPYERDTETNIGVSMGVKYVGEPWVVKVPTSLVYLQKDGELNQQ